MQSKDSTKSTDSPTVAERLKRTRSGKSYDIPAGNGRNLIHSPPTVSAMDNELLREMIQANRETNSQIATMMGDHSAFRENIIDEHNALRADMLQLTEKLGALAAVVQNGVKAPETVAQVNAKSAIVLNGAPSNVQGIPPQPRSVHSNEAPAISQGNPQHPRFRELKFMSFAKNDCEGWFAAFERMLHTRRITDDAEMYDALIAHLNYDVLTTLFGFIQDIPDVNQYASLKNKLMSKYALSAESKLEKLFQDTSLANKRPSEVMNEMRRHAGNDIQRDMLMRIWRKRLPGQIRVAIANVGNDQAVEFADNAFDAARDIEESCSRKTDDTASKQMSQDIARLRQDIARLTAQVSSQKSSRNYAPETPYAPSSKSNNAKRASGSEVHTRVDAGSPRVESRDGNTEKTARGEKRDETRLNNGLCRAHFNFGNKARSCIPQCSRYDDFIEAKKGKRAGNE